MTLAALGGLLVATVPASSASAAGPRFYATAACTTGHPYKVNAFLDGFAPNDTFLARTANYRNGKFQYYLDLSVTTDANGAASFGGFEFNEPYQIGILFFHDRDKNNTYSSGDDTIADLILNIDQPCTGGVAQPK